MTNTITAQDLDGIDEGQRSLLRDERAELEHQLRQGIAPVVCLSRPGERPRVVRLTSLRDLDARGAPWRGL